MKVLIVDDDFYSRSMLHDMLRPLGQCDIAVNGEEAVFAFRKAIEAGESYDLICLDLVMPEMDGQEALQEIRAIEREEMERHPSQETKVIVTTMLDDKKETHDAFFLGGATSYLVKPIEEEKLLGELKSLKLLTAAES